MKYLISFLLLILSLSAADLAAEYQALSAEYEKLQKTYWDKKETMLKERTRTEDDLKTIEDELRSAYMKKNSLMDSLYLGKENLEKTKLQLEEKESTAAAFANRLEELQDRESRRIRGLYPSQLEASILRLGEVKSRLSDINDTEGALAALLDYKLYTIYEGEQNQVYRTTVIDPRDKASLKVTALRAGFIHNSFQADDRTGLLIRSAGLSGIFYNWETDLDGGMSDSIQSAIDRSLSRHGQEGKVYIPVDSSQAGKKLKSILDTSSGGVFGRALEYFLSGGPIMYPLMAVLILAIFIIIERFRFYRRNSEDVEPVISRIISSVKENKNEKALELARETPSPITRVILPLIRKNNFTRETAEQILTERMIEEGPALDRRMPTLAILAAIAPLLGLLGTVSGMITLFDVITVYGTSNPKILAGGISIALVTTQTGLALAIPIMLVHHYLTRLKTRIANAMEKYAIQMLNIFYPENNA